MKTFKTKRAARALLGALALVLGVVGLLVGSSAFGLIAVVLGAVLLGGDLDALLPE